MLEHRCSPRKTVALEATLHHRQLGRLECDTRNIGPEGAFVTTSTAKIAKDALVTLVVQTTAGKVRVAHRMRALVVHADSGGLGLMFLKPNPAFYSTIGNVESETAKAASER